jgi:hypothetical protein
MIRTQSRLSILTGLIGGLVVLFSALVPVPAQSTNQTATQTANQTQTTTQTADQQKAQLAMEEKAMRLIDQVLSDAQSLKLPENRVRVDFTVADMIWVKDEARARTLFAEAATILAQMIGNIDVNDRRQFNNLQSITRLRQELVTIAARHDARLAQDLLNQTKMQQVQNQQNNPFGRGSADANLEATLLTQIAASDPKTALDNAQTMLDKGDYSNGLVNLLTQLETKDPDSGAKLADKIVKQLSSENLSTNNTARNLAISLLSPGPLPAQSKDDPPPAQTNTNSNWQALLEGPYKTLLNSVVTAALNVTVTPPQQNAAGGGRGGRGGGQGGGPGGRFGGQMDPGTVFLISTQSILTQVDKYSPNNAAALRQKLSEAGFGGGGNNPQQQMRQQMNQIAQNGTSDSIMAAASSAPAQMQNRLYQQAAMKAVEEGNQDKASQIASQHLNSDSQTQIQQAIDTQKVINSVSQGNMDQARQLLARLQSDQERINVLLQIVGPLVLKGETKMAQQLLDEARNIVSHRATSYEDLQSELKVAQAYAAVDASQSFRVMEPGIAQINELVYAASILNGFEIRLFKDDELPLQPDNTLSSIVSDYSKQLSKLASVDFEGAQATADKFQRPEARLMAKLSIARGVLGGTDVTDGNQNRRGPGGGPGGQAGRRGGN